MRFIKNILPNTAVSLTRTIHVDIVFMHYWEQSSIILSLKKLLRNCCQKQHKTRIFRKCKKAYLSSNYYPICISKELIYVCVFWYLRCNEHWKGLWRPIRLCLCAGRLEVRNIQNVGSTCYTEIFNTLDPSQLNWLVPLFPGCSHWFHQFWVLAHFKLYLQKCNYLNLIIFKMVWLQCLLVKDMLLCIGDKHRTLHF